MDRTSVGRWNRIASPARRALPAVLPILFAGCGTNLNEVLLQSGTATGRTLIDLWLTDFENRLADSLYRIGAASGDGGSTTDQGG